MLVVAVVGLCRHAVEIGDGFSCKLSNGNELWSLLVVRNHVAKYGIPFCWDSTAAVGQQLVDREGGVSYVKLTELFEKVMWSSPMVLHMSGFSDVLHRYVCVDESLPLCGRCRESFLAHE